jgi:hypothetical protein
MSAQLREKAGDLAEVLWREHTVYRDRAGGVVIRSERVQRWISLAPAGGLGQILVRAGRILDGGTTAPARSEAIVPLSAGTAELAITCRRLLADTTADALPRPPRGSEAGRSWRTSRRATKRANVASWVAVSCMVALVALYLHDTGVIGG